METTHPTTTCCNNQNQHLILCKGHEDLEGKATTSLILGIVGMIAWVLPFAGFPINIIGIIKAAKGLRSTKSGTAIAGLVLSIIGLVLTMTNSGMIMYTGRVGQYFNQ